MLKWQELPPHIFYPMLIPHVIKLCIKYRATPALITASNPCFKWGGLPYTSKSDMLDVFEGHLRLKHQLIPVDLPDSKKKALLKAFISKTTFPIIVKPETGHRGLDVKKADTEAQLYDMILNQKWNYMIQEFSPYPQEFGVFYYRYPSQDKGDVFSITHKIIPSVIGDGVSTMKQLIEAGDFPKKDHYFDTLKDYELDRVLEKGESANLMVTAAHCYGTYFGDGTQYKTQALVDKMNDICQDRDFYFGRLDVKAESIDAFQRGEFDIMEVNGATSEFGHTFDDKFSFKEGMALFKQQWDMVFEIAHDNRDRAEKMSFSEFMSRYIRFFIQSKQATGKIW